MNRRCNMKMRCPFVASAGALLIAIVMGTCYQSDADASCNVTSNGSGSVGRITKFTPLSCNIENSAIFESSGKVGIGTTTPAATLDVNGGGVIRGATGIGAAASGGFEFQVSAPNQTGLLIEAPASGVGAGLDFKTTGSGGLQWEILDTGATAAQGPNELNIRNVNTATDILTITANGDVGILNPPLIDVGLTVNGTGEAVVGLNNNTEATLFMVNEGPGPAAVFQTNGQGLAAEISGGGGKCDFDGLGDLTCTGTVTGGAAWHGRGRIQQPTAVPVPALARGNQSAQEHLPPSTATPVDWLEDFGSARLKNGAASIALNSDFANAVNGDNYQVFVTPGSDCKGLYVTRKRKHGFEVRELGGGRSSVEFDYRVVGQHPKIHGPMRMSASGDVAKLAVGNRPTS